MNQHNRAPGASTATPADTSAYNDEGLTVSPSDAPTCFDELALQQLAQGALNARDLTNRIAVAHERITALIEVMDDEFDGLNVDTSSKARLYALAWAIRTQAACLKASTLVQGGAA